MQIWIVLDEARWCENFREAERGNTGRRATEPEILLVWMWLRTRPFSERLDRQYYIPLDRWWRFNQKAIDALLGPNPDGKQRLAHHVHDKPYWMHP